MVFLGISTFVTTPFFSRLISKFSEDNNNKERNDTLQQNHLVTFLVLTIGLIFLVRFC